MALLNLLLRTRVCIITTSTNAELAAIKQGLFIAQIILKYLIAFLAYSVNVDLAIG